MSDHISGPRALADPIADITDFYAFPSPEHPGALVLVMNTLPFAKPSDLFSDGLVYRFRLRPLTTGDGRAAVPRRRAGARFDCVFSPPAAARRASVQDGTCTTPAGDVVPFRVNDVKGASGMGSACSPACAGTRSSWMRPRR